MIVETSAPITIGTGKYRLLWVQNTIALQSLKESELDQPEEWYTIKSNLTIEQAQKNLRELRLSLDSDSNSWLN